MKRWQIILIIILVALFCGCVGMLLGFALGEQIGARNVEGTLLLAAALI